VHWLIQDGQIALPERKVGMWSRRTPSFLKARDDTGH
jgi:hypothetical protein